MAGQAGRLQVQHPSAVNYPSSGHARRCLIWLSCDNRRTRYTAPLARKLRLGHTIPANVPPLSRSVGVTSAAAVYDRYREVNIRETTYVYNRSEAHPGCLLARSHTHIHELRGLGSTQHRPFSVPTSNATEKQTYALFVCGNAS
ncbi:hypothetical protein J6590_070755 [Homalodisca vitripennis]|nr:hypothetical protein J6590_070755 [Homalodisca vitripennis]